MFKKRKFLDSSLSKLADFKKEFTDLSSQSETNRARIVAIKKEAKTTADKLWIIKGKCYLFSLKSEVYSAWIEFNNFYTKIFDFLYVNNISMDDEEDRGKDEPR